MPLRCLVLDLGGIYEPGNLQLICDAWKRLLNGHNNLVVCSTTLRRVAEKARSKADYPASTTFA